MYLVKILEKKKADLTKPDYKHQLRVAVYLKRRVAQKPNGYHTLITWHFPKKTGDTSKLKNKFIWG